MTTGEKIKYFRNMRALPLGAHVFFETSPIRRLFVFWRGGARELLQVTLAFAGTYPFPPAVFCFLRWGVNALALLRPTRPDLFVAEHVLATVRPARVVLPVSDEYQRTVGEIQCAPLWNTRNFAPLWVRLAVGAVAGQTLRTMLVRFVCLQDGKIKISSSECVRGNAASASSGKTLTTPFVYHYCEATN